MTSQIPHNPYSLTRNPSGTNERVYPVKRQFHLREDMPLRIRKAAIAARCPDVEWVRRAIDSALEAQGF